MPLLGSSRAVGMAKISSSYSDNGQGSKSVSFGTGGSGDGMWNASSCMDSDNDGAGM